MRVENPGYVPHGTFRYPRFVSITGYRFPNAAIYPAHTAWFKLAQFELNTPAGCFCHSFLRENAADKKLRVFHVEHLDEPSAWTASGHWLRIGRPDFEIPIFD